MGNCQSDDGTMIQANGRNECWTKGGDKWTGWGMETRNPYKTADKLKAQLDAANKSAEVAKTALDAAKSTQSTAVAATAVAAKADDAAVKAEAAKVEAAKTADAAKLAAAKAKEVRDKCIVDANDAHKKAMQACGPEAMKEGFGGSEGFGGGFGMWLLLLVILLVFVAICMQGKESSVSKDGFFQIDGALV